MDARTVRAAALPFLLTLAYLAPLVHGTVFGAGNDASRFAQIESIVDYGQTSIEHSRYHWTIDRTTIDGRDYSNKPPLLALVGALVYAVLERLTGMSFATHEAAVLYLLTLCLVAVPTASLVTLFHRSLKRFWNGSRTTTLVTVALAAGTILTSFSTTFNNHTVAAALLFAACERALSCSVFASGTLIALTACVDVVPGLVFAPALVAILHAKAGSGRIRRFSVALLGGAMLFVAANLYVVGSPWPPKMAPGAVDYSSSTGPQTAGVLLPTSWTYPFSALFGWHGFFSVSPVLLFGALGMARSLRRDERVPRQDAPVTHRGIPRGATIWLAAATAVTILGHVLLVGSYGGWSYGFRYLIPVVPVLLFYAPAALNPVGRRAFVSMAFVLILLISCFTALLGAYNPWPPGDEPGTGKHPVASVVTNPIGGNLAAWLREHAPGTSLADSAARLFISPDKEPRDQYLRLFYASRGDVAMMNRISD